MGAKGWPLNMAEAVETKKESNGQDDREEREKERANEVARKKER